eukprot:scaffold39917_cov49-Phaeocystis_antarctica.AAC.2
MCSSLLITAHHCAPQEPHEARLADAVLPHDAVPGVKDRVKGSTWKPRPVSYLGGTQGPTGQCSGAERGLRSASWPRAEPACFSHGAVLVGSAIDPGLRPVAHLVRVEVRVSPNPTPNPNPNPSPNPNQVSGRVAHDADASTLEKGPPRVGVRLGSGLEREEGPQQLSRVRQLRRVRHAAYHDVALLAQPALIRLLLTRLLSSLPLSTHEPARACTPPPRDPGRSAARRRRCRGAGCRWRGAARRAAPRARACRTPAARQQRAGRGSATPSLTQLVRIKLARLSSDGLALPGSAAGCSPLHTPLPNRALTGLKLARARGRRQHRNGRGGHCCRRAAGGGGLHDRARGGGLPAHLARLLRRALRARGYLRAPPRRTRRARGQVRLTLTAAGAALTLTLALSTIPGPDPKPALALTLLLALTLTSCCDGLACNVEQRPNALFDPAWLGRVVSGKQAALYLL